MSQAVVPATGLPPMPDGGFRPDGTFVSWPAHDTARMTEAFRRAAELQTIGHKPNCFYLQHATGLALSLGLGIALSWPEVTVVVFDGDGSVLMNLVGLTTLARYRPKNLVHVVFDNESLLSVGGFPTATSTGSDRARVCH